ncbi:hypothetical protein VNO78_25460 [Psophocarpus tetragonolobus]|uniref:Uncharacterized protein n=1 Tax=Psophocarpus tetragonolobus TaxID=3891 RepID=A0AAN9S7U4_PSOTE
MSASLSDLRPSLVPIPDLRPFQVQIVEHRGREEGAAQQGRWPRQTTRLPADDSTAAAQLLSWPLAVVGILIPIPKHQLSNILQRCKNFQKLNLNRIEYRHLADSALIRLIY